MGTLKLKVKRLSEEAQLPTKAHTADAGFDLVSTSRVFDKVGNATYGTGIAIEIPNGYVGLIFPRSSVANKDLTLANCVGVIDSGYRGEIMLKFKPALIYADRGSVGTDDDDYEGSNQTDINTQYVTAHGRMETCGDVAPGTTPFTPRVYEIGERIGQLIIMPIPEVEIVEVSCLEDSDRGQGGFGSTGK